jgi:hypothetical protein
MSKKHLQYEDDKETIVEKIENLLSECDVEFDEDQLDYIVEYLIQSFYTDID